jgi:hypothetical protein
MRPNGPREQHACVVGVFAPLRHGLSLIREGRAAEGIPPLKAGLAFWDAIGGKVWSPYGNSVLAYGMAMTGDVDNALNLIDEQIAQVERPGWEERLHYAEILRLKGWILTRKDDLVGAEKNYLASLDWARAASQILGTTHLDQPRSAMAIARQTQRSPRSARTRLQLVHRRFRYQGSKGSECAAGRPAEIATHSHREGATARSPRIPGSPEKGRCSASAIFLSTPREITSLSGV